jgi:hypothetical protein
VLAAVSRTGGLRGAVNGATDDDLFAAARDRGLDPLAFDAE